MSETWIYGFHAVKELLTSKLRPTYEVWINTDRHDPRMQAIVSLAQTHQVPIHPLTAALKERFNTVAHQGILAKTKALPHFQEADLPFLLENSKKPACILILDTITDPHNLGACLRTANAAGVDFVITPSDKSAPLTAVVSKVACGACEVLPVVRVTNLVRAMERLKQEGVWIFGAAGEAPASLYQLDTQSSLALVLGGEEKGLRRLTREHCDALFSIPMAGTVESLNVSVATGVALFEVVRQRFWL